MSRIHSLIVHRATSTDKSHHDHPTLGPRRNAILDQNVSCQVALTSRDGLRAVSPSSAAALAAVGGLLGLGAAAAGLRAPQPELRMAWLRAQLGLPRLALPLLVLRGARDVRCAERQVYNTEPKKNKKKYPRERGERAGAWLRNHKPHMCSLRFAEL